jgi:hypothetical protein
LRADSVRAPARVAPVKDAEPRTDCSSTRTRWPGLACPIAVPV